MRRMIDLAAPAAQEVRRTGCGAVLGCATILMATCASSLARPPMAADMAASSPAAAQAHPANEPHGRHPPSGGSAQADGNHRPGATGNSGSGAHPGGGGYNPGTSGSRPPYNSGANGGANPGGGGYNPGTSGSRPPYNSGANGGANPGQGGSGGGYNPGSNWNGHSGLGWNPGNAYRSDLIQGWVRLGSAFAGKAADKDTIQAYGRYRYKQIKFCVRGADVGFHDVRVVYERGGQQQLQVRTKVNKGSCSPAYYVWSGRYDIRYVYLYFRQADNFLNWRQAEVDLYAR